MCTVGNWFGKLIVNCCAAVQRAVCSACDDLEYDLKVMSVGEKWKPTAILQFGSTAGIKNMVA